MLALNYNPNSFSFNFSLSPLRRQVILESSGSLSPSMPLSQLLCENPDYLPPALPPKRQRANSKTLNSLNTPPSSPKMCLNESNDEIAETTSQHLNRNNVAGKKNSLASDTLSNSSSKPVTPVTPTTPSFAVTPSITPSKSANVPLVSHTSPSNNLTMKSPTTITIKGPNNNATDIDVRSPIYSNDNSSNTNNSRYSNDTNHYIHLYDGGSANYNDKHKQPNNKNGIDNDSDSDKTKIDGDGAGSNSINSNSKMKNNININNNNNSNTSDNNEHDDESIVVLRHPSASKHSQKVRLNFLLHFFPLVSLSISFVIQIQYFLLQRACNQFVVLAIHSTNR